MAELTPQERLQPSLLDRLTDDERGESQESRERRVLSLRKLRECVLRDLAWLLNAGNLAATEDLDEYPLVAGSVLNYGMSDFSGRAASGIDASRMERDLRQAIIDFEPRILRQSVRVHISMNREQMSQNTLTIEIEGELWAQPVPERLFLQTQIDLETGHVTVSEAAGKGS